ncbi:iron-siderophore ABC transporter substrate-binding protein [Salinibacterium sp. ZJ450]|uniref:iron-siderophore ABC transporter substrate-binding protein n=1 Tax=Salinibacterium sp. ZJ450 TaxID=2708338 RepID=UPI001CD7EBA3|nr:iron-siderophore ABC transporter substrate-binding protein [Salinibacterium sp. ZJ450]
MTVRPLAIVAALAASMLAITGCAAATPSDVDSTSGGGDFSPVSIEHAFGETEISAAPERVVTLGWGSTDAALALGVVPVAMEAQSYGGDENGVLPWVAEKLDELGEETPTVIPESTEAPAYEQIAEAAPDLILAVYSGITEEQYALLSEIAPTVAYPDEAWSTPWRDVISTVGDALGKSAEADVVLDEIAAVVDEQAAAHPELKGKTVAAVWDVGGTFYVYKEADSRVQFLLDLGMVSAPAVDELASGDSTFYYTLSYEQLDKLDSDILVNFAADDAAAEAFLATSYAQAIPAVQAGTVASGHRHRTGRRGVAAHGAVAHLGHRRVRRSPRHRRGGREVASTAK